MWNASSSKILLVLALGSHFEHSVEFRVQGQWVLWHHVCAHSRGHTEQTKLLKLETLETLHPKTLNHP